LEIVIDTNAIYGDPRLTGAKIRTLCETAKVTGDTVCIPQIVVDEAKNKYHEQLVSYKIKIDKALSDIIRLTGKAHTTTLDSKSIEDELASTSKKFDEQIDALGIKVLPYPKTPHEVIAKRAVKKKKPFTESGKGYRDALIWENIKELIKPAKKTIDDPQVVLITKNYSDFCEQDFQLHHDLNEELKVLKAPDNSVEVIKDIEKVIDKYCKPKQKILDDIKSELEQGKHKKLNVREKVEKLVFSYLENKGFDPKDIGFPMEYESPSVSEIHEDYEFKIDEVRQLSETEILINGTVQVTCTFDVFIYKSDFYTMDEDEAPSIWDYDWNDHYLAGSKEQTITLKVFLTVDSAFYEIISNEIELVER
jgi:PIN domain